MSLDGPFEMGKFLKRQEADDQASLGCVSDRQNKRQARLALLMFPALPPRTDSEVLSFSQHIKGLMHSQWGRGGF